VEGGYRFRFLVERASAGPHRLRRHRRRVAAHLDLGQATTWSTRALLGAFLRMPLLTAGVVFRIHWQALRLWIKGVPFVGARSSHQQQPLQESSK
jgi:DUF1365 family protein